MAKTTVVVRTDDYDLHHKGAENSGDDVENLTFAIGENSYEIDLSEKNRTALTKALHPYVEAARPAAKAPAPGKKANGARAPRPSEAAHDLSAVRTWAQDNGYVLGNRGRIPKHILDAFAEAGSPS